MERNKERVLAYSMAKVIEHDDLSEVSGGYQLSHGRTVAASGASGQGVDVHVDITVDW